MFSLNENAQKVNNSEFYTLKEVLSKKVVEHNDLITSAAKMDKTSLKIFELAVACLNTEKLPEDNTISLSKAELFAFFKVTDTNRNSRFKKVIVNLHRQAVFAIDSVDEQTGKPKYQVISPIEKTAWNDYEDEVSITFTKSILPYLVDLKSNFTQYTLGDLLHLNSKYSIMLYKWFSMNYNKFEYYSCKGACRKEQLESYSNPVITLKELRAMTNTTNDYKRMDNFENRVLREPLEEINKHTHFKVTYEKIKKGRKIHAIAFHIEKKRVADDPSYKENDVVYQEDKKQKEENEQKLMVDALQSKYTKILLKNMLLNSYDLTDIKLMAGLQTNVYNKYDELVKLRGLNGVEEHLSYVASKQNAYSKRNVAKYLKKSITQYLITVKQQTI